jgi:hypothetical protein
MDTVTICTIMILVVPFLKGQDDGVKIALQAMSDSKIWIASRLAELMETATSRVKWTAYCLCQYHNKFMWGPLYGEIQLADKGVKTDLPRKHFGSSLALDRPNSLAHGTIPCEFDSEAYIKHTKFEN